MVCLCRAAAIATDELYATYRLRNSSLAILVHYGTGSGSDYSILSSTSIGLVRELGSAINCTHVFRTASSIIGYRDAFNAYPYGTGHMVK